MIECHNCGKKIEGNVIRPEELGNHPFCSWDCALTFLRNETVRKELNNVSTTPE